MHEILQPDGWAKPVGYSNGIAATGRLVFIGGQIGWNAQCEFESDDFVAQARQTLLNVVAVLEEAGAEPAHLTTLTWYVTDKRVYQARLREIGAVYREIVGRHYPAMAAVEVSALMEPRARIEISGMAVIPEPGGRVVPA